jgi:Holliday junction DNA helicase RuvB
MTQVRMGYGGGGHFAERIAALGVATAWQNKANTKRQVAKGAQIIPLHGSAPVKNTTGDLLMDPQYPQSWEDYIGQDEAKSTIQAAIARAVERQEPCRHLLIVDPEPGKGKTALAVLAARSMEGARCFTISGSPTYTQARQTILGMRPGDVLFIDEIHRLVVGGKGRAEWLLHVLENDALIGPMGVERANLGITVIGATTEDGKLPDTITSRFGPPILLRRLDFDEAMHVAIGVATRIFAPKPRPTEDEYIGVVFAADFNPRRIRTLLEAFLDTHYEAEGPSLERVFTRTRITPDGLDWTSQRYLIALRGAAGPMGVSHMQSILGQPDLKYVERRLNERGLITFTKQGRALTGDGMDRATQLVEQEDA